MRAAMRFLAYPVVVIGGATMVVAALSVKMSPWHVVPPILAAAALTVIVLERRLPYVATWNIDRGDTKTDVAHFIGNLVVSHASLAIFALTRPL